MYSTFWGESLKCLNYVSRNFNFKENIEPTSAPAHTEFYPEGSHEGYIN